MRSTRTTMHAEGGLRIAGLVARPLRLYCLDLILGVVWAQQFKPEAIDWQRRALSNAHYPNHPTRRGAAAADTLFAIGVLQR